jgi:hypothetical protein
MHLDSNRLLERARCRYRHDASLRTLVDAITENIRNGPLPLATVIEATALVCQEFPEAFDLYVEEVERCHSMPPDDAQAVCRDIGAGRATVTDDPDGRFDRAVVTRRETVGVVSWEGK